MKRLLAWAPAIVSGGLPPDDLSPRTMQRLEPVIVAICALATLVVIVIALAAVLR